MKQTVREYHVEELIAHSKSAQLYTGRRRSDNVPVIIKKSQKKSASLRKNDQIIRERSVLARLKNVDGVIKLHDDFHEDDSFFLILEDIGGQSLNTIMGNESLPIKMFFKIAPKLVTIIGKIHEAGIVHKDINPSNIIWNRNTNEVRIIDFGISSIMSYENLEISKSKEFEGTLHYISPEQTGRINRVIDYRSDYYSLGVTFYRLLTGILPFNSNDIMEIIHAHIARNPVAPHSVKGMIPHMLSSIIMKLMHKMAVERYQSFFGLYHDIEQCRKEYEINGVVEDFVLGEEDVSTRFMIPQKLFGRNHELALLEKKFQNTLLGNGSTVIICGEGGIGKTALVNEIGKISYEQKAYFISSKCEQYHNDVPFSAIIQLFRVLVNQVLTESDQKIKAWAEKINTELRPNGKLLTDMVKELEYVIGPQPEVNKLPLLEAENRLKFTMVNFLKLFCRDNNKLVLFIDDLQWVDQSTISFIENMTHSFFQHKFFLILSYRDTEIDDNHAIKKMLQNLNHSGNEIDKIVLSSLNRKSISNMLEEILHKTECEVEELAEVVEIKTGGNPFFINKFLHSIYDSKLIWFDTSIGKWQFDVQAIAGEQITDNVAEFIADKIKQLPVDTQQVIKAASVIGTSFELSLISSLFDKSETEMDEILFHAAIHGLIYSNNEKEDTIYTFVHDRILQAAYNSIDAERCLQLHLKVAREITARNQNIFEDDTVFTLVEHYNIAQKYLKKEERDKLLSLNLAAGTKAAGSSAHQAALQYFEKAIELSGDNLWKVHREKAVELFSKAAESAYLSTSLPEMDFYIHKLSDHALNIYEKITPAKIKMLSLTMSNNFEASISTGLEILRQLDIKIPKKPKLYHILKSVTRVAIRLMGKSDDELVALQKLKAKKESAIVDIATQLFVPSYLYSSELLAMFTLLILKISIKHGYSPVAPFVYVMYGVLLIDGLNKIDEGYRMGKLGLKLAERIDDKSGAAKAMVGFYGFINHWKDPVSNSFEYLKKAHIMALKAGDFEFAANATHFLLFNLLMSGRELNELLDEFSNYQERLDEIRQESIIDLNNIFNQLIKKLLNPSEEPWILSDNFFDELEEIKAHRKHNNLTGVFDIFFSKAILAYFFNQYDKALEYIKESVKYIEGTRATLVIPVWTFYDSLIHIAAFRYGETGLTESEVKKKVKKNQEKLKNWSDKAPHNYLHKYYIVAGEYNILCDNHDNVMTNFEKALTLLSKNSLIQDEALTYELSGRYQLSRDNRMLAAYYFSDAYFAYNTWGALSKMRQTESLYGDLIFSVSKKSLSVSVRKTTRSSSDNYNYMIDLHTIIRSSHAISREIKLQVLLSKIMKTVMENAGAQKGFLLMRKNKKWHVDVKVEDEEVSFYDNQMLDTINRSHLQLPATLINYAIRLDKSIVINSGSSAHEFSDDPYIIKYKPKSILCLPLKNNLEIIAVLYLENRLLEDAFTSERFEILSLLTSHAASALEKAILYKKITKINESYERFVPKQFLGYLGNKTIIDVKPGDYCEDIMTIFSLDIRNFTAMSERMSPEENFIFINAFLSLIDPIIKRYDGFINTYIGDGIIAVFKNKPDNAVFAALEIQKEINKFNKLRIEAGECEIAIGIGVSTGQMLLGTIGSAKRMNSTIVGKPLKEAISLKQLTKTIDKSFLITKEVINNIKDPDRFNTELVSKIHMKGSEKPISLYTIQQQ